LRFANTKCPKKLADTWEWKRYRNIQWLNTAEKREKGGPWELALQNLPYSYSKTENYTDDFYSHVVLLIRVPKMVKRNLTVNA
jgi:hypothetical protein